MIYLYAYRHLNLLLVASFICLDKHHMLSLSDTPHVQLNINSNWCDLSQIHMIIQEVYFPSSVAFLHLFLVINNYLKPTIRYHSFSS